MFKKALLSSILLFMSLCSTVLASCGNNDLDMTTTIIDNLSQDSTAMSQDTASVVKDATTIMQNATVISSEEYIYAFGISQMVIIGDQAYIYYRANKNKLDGDAVNNTNESCCSVVDLHNMGYRTVTPYINSKKYSDSSDAPANSVIGYGTRTESPNGEIVSFALLRSNNNNPYYCYAFVKSSEQKFDYVTCKLKYTDTLGKEYLVDFTINNYRQMLVNMGYENEYIASTSDAYDNINLHYDKDNGMYYAVVATSNSNSYLPIVLMQSTDMEKWSPCVNTGSIYGANEISAILKDGIINICYRTYRNGMRWLIYDITNNVILSEGRFDECRNVLSKPDTFTFGQDVYMAVNVYPSIYGNRLSYDPLTVRQEINIYKVVNGKPEFFRKVYNPDGINYFSFQEASNGRIFLAFSEDRRHLYKRLFSNVSIVDVTEFFNE